MSCRPPRTPTFFLCDVPPPPPGRLVLALLILEDQTDQLKSEVDGAPSAGGRVGTPSASEAAKFYPGHPVSAQPMLLNAITGALKQVRRRWWRFGGFWLVVVNYLADGTVHFRSCGHVILSASCVEVIMPLRFIVGIMTAYMMCVCTYVLHSCSIDVLYQVIFAVDALSNSNK